MNQHAFEIPAIEINGRDTSITGVAAEGACHISEGSEVLLKDCSFGCIRSGDAAIRARNMTLRWRQGTALTYRANGLLIQIGTCALSVHGRIESKVTKSGRRLCKARLPKH